MSSAFVVKAVSDEQPSQPIPGVFDELVAGRARIGWSYQDNLDLRLLLNKLEEGEQLDSDEQRARRCLGFLTRPDVGDYLLYPHQPERGKFTVVRVSGKYDYSTADDGLNFDFRSFRPCSLTTLEPVDMYDQIVSSQLRHRLGRPGRFSRVYDTTPLLLFLKELPLQGRHQDGSNTMSVQRIHTELRQKLPDALRREFAQADLSRRFCSDLFDRMGYSTDVQEGPGEAGSDLIVTIGNPLLPTEFRIGVQAFAYEETVEEWALKRKLDQLIQGWEKNSLDYGVLLTTGRCSEPAKTALRNYNKHDEDRQVTLIEGDDLADLFLQYFPPGTE